MKDLAGNTAIVVPVRDEEGSIVELLDSFEALSVKPREIIVVDGGSKDKTVKVIKEYISSHHNLPYRLRLIELEEAFPGRARNVGIESSSARIIACTDSGGVVEEDWLRHLILPFGENPKLEVVIGNCLPYARNAFEECAFSVNIKGMDKTRFTYFGAVSIAFLKDTWQKVGKYPDDIYPNEDKCFLTKLKRYGAKFHLSEKAAVRWQPRSNPAEFSLQYFSYGRADARFNFVPMPHVTRILAYTSGTIFAIMGFSHRVFWLVCLVSLAGYLSGPALRACVKLKRPGAFLYVPFLILIKDVSQIFGYVSGSLERLMNPAYRKIAREKFLLKDE